MSVKPTDCSCGSSSRDLGKRDGHGNRLDGNRLSKEFNRPFGTPASEFQRVLIVEIYAAESGTALSCGARRHALTFFVRPVAIRCEHEVQMTVRHAQRRQAQRARNHRRAARRGPRSEDADGHLPDLENPAAMSALTLIMTSRQPASTRCTEAEDNAREEGFVHCHRRLSHASSFRPSQRICLSYRVPRTT